MAFVHENPVIVTPLSSVLPISVADVKLLAKINYPQEDSLFDDFYIPGVTDISQEMLARLFITATLKVTWAKFPSGNKRVNESEPAPNHLWLPFAPAVDITEVSYIDSAGDTQTDSDPENSGTWLIRKTLEPATIGPATGTSWPPTLAVPSAVSVTYTCGYGAAGTDVPALIRVGLAQMCAHWSQHREPVLVGTIQSQLKMIGAASFMKYTWRPVA